MGKLWGWGSGVVALVGWWGGGAARGVAVAMRLGRFGGAEFRRLLFASLFS